MEDYILMTDSTCDLPDSFVKELGVDVVPLSFVISGSEYKHYPDARQLGFGEFYKKLREGEMSSTAQINQNDFIERCKRFMEEGYDVLYIGFSSALSGTFNNSLLAARELKEMYPERKLVCVDSLCASVGEGMLVYNAALKKKDGMGIDELTDWVESEKLHMCHWFTVDDLHHLKRGGRVSAVAAVMGTALGIKPVLHVDDEGRLIPQGKVRGRKKSLEMLYQKLSETIVSPESQTVFIGHGDCAEDAEYLADLIKKNFKVKDVVTAMIGPVIGTHSGPGTVALFFFGTHR